MTKPDTKESPPRARKHAEDVEPARIDPRPSERSIHTDYNRFER